MMEALKYPVAVGQRLGKYLLTEKLGEGGMGVVFGGTHEALGREVAVKLLRAQFAQNEQVVARFEQEAEAVSRIGHANIVAVYDFGRLDDGSLYFVMERIRGETVAQRLRRQPPMSPEETASLFEQSCRALQAAHARHVVHRDLKPDNILLQPQAGGLPHVKLVDFGIAKMRESDAEGDGKLTRSGTVLGTPEYMAPEQVTDPKGVDARADLYALGCMLYEVLTGTPPFGRGGEMLAMLKGHIHDQPVPPSEKAQAAGRAAVSPALDAMVLKALAKNPNDRFADAAGFNEALREALGLQARSATRIADAAEVAKVGGTVKARSKTGIVVGAAVAVAALGGGLTMLALRHRAGPATQTAPAVAKPAVAVAALGEETPLQIEANKALATALGGGALARRAAVEAMGEVADRAALEQVVTALGDDNPEVRRAAANAAAAFGRRDDAALAQALAAAAERSGGSVAIDVAAARFKLGDAGAETDLQNALAMRDPAGRLRAAEALAEAGKVPAKILRAAIAGAPPTVRRELRWSAYVQLHKLGDAAFDQELRSALAGADPVARLDAAQTLARSGDAGGRAALAKLAKDAPDPVDRVDAAAVLAELKDVGALSSLLGMLDSDAAAVRARAATSLGRLAPLVPNKDQLTQKLAALLKDKDPAPRVAAAAALLALEAARSTRKP